MTAWILERRDTDTDRFRPTYILDGWPEAQALARLREEAARWGPENVRLLRGAAS